MSLWNWFTRRRAKLRVPILNICECKQCMKVRKADEIRRNLQEPPTKVSVHD